MKKRERGRGLAEGVVLDTIGYGRCAALGMRGNEDKARVSYRRNRA